MAQKGMAISDVEGYLTTLESGAANLDELTETYQFQHQVVSKLPDAFQCLEEMGI